MGVTIDYCEYCGDYTEFNENGMCLNCGHMSDHEWGGEDDGEAEESGEDR